MKRGLLIMMLASALLEFLWCSGDQGTALPLIECVPCRKHCILRQTFSLLSLMSHALHHSSSSCNFWSRSAMQSPVWGLLLPQRYHLLQRIFHQSPRSPDVVSSRISSEQGRCQLQSQYVTPISITCSTVPVRLSFNIRFKLHGHGHLSRIAFSAYRRWVGGQGIPSNYQVTNCWIITEDLDLQAPNMFLKLATQSQTAQLVEWCSWFEEQHSEYEASLVQRN